MAKVITVFGSARPEEGDSQFTEAYSLGKSLAAAGFILCNGGYGGTMEAAARGARECNGHTIGVTVDNFGRQANRYIEKEIREPTLLDRLQRLVSLGDAYVVLRGGTGTLLELALVWELINKGLMTPKPFILLGEFWNDLVRTMERETQSEGNHRLPMRPAEAGSPEECVDLLKRQLS
jgi:hypothetical protein